MAKIDYDAIRIGVKAAVEEYQPLENASVFVEQEPQFGLSDNQCVIAIFMDRRRAPIGSQKIRRGTSTDYEIVMSLWTLYFSMTSYEEACRGRDSALGDLELALMTDRTFGGAVEMSWLEGGEMLSARNADASSFVAAAETILIAAAQATTS